MKRYGILLVAVLLCMACNKEHTTTLPDDAAMRFEMKHPQHAPRQRHSSRATALDFTSRSTMAMRLRLSKFRATGPTMLRHRSMVNSGRQPRKSFGATAKWMSTVTIPIDTCFHRRATLCGGARPVDGAQWRPVGRYEASDFFGPSRRVLHKPKGR